MTSGPSMRRLQRELCRIQAEGVSPTVHIVPVSGNLRQIEALVVGPPDTPYDGAMLHFRLKVPPEYPMKPPEMKLLSTENGALRIHPQLYADGKVCLSILGTWLGPKWTAGLSLRTLLLSVQSLLNEEPLRCEPGYEEAPQDMVDRASIFVTHEVCRVLILGALTGPSWGTCEEMAPLTAAMREHLRARRAPLLRKMRALALHDGQVLQSPCPCMVGPSGRRYEFAKLARRLAELLPGEAGIPGVPGAAGSHQESTDGQGGGPEGTAEKAHCRICHQTEEESGMELIYPCRCAGSIRFVHAQCLLAWLQHSAVASSAWRCDICGLRFKVKLGVGRPPGLRYLCRDLDSFADQDFEASGLAAILLISMLQIVLTTAGRMAALTALRLAGLACASLPINLGAMLFPLLGALAVALDLGSELGYFALFGLKVAVAWGGPGWHPARWGVLWEERVSAVLAMAELLSLSLSLQLRGLLVLIFCLTANHLWFMARGCSFLVDLLLGSGLAPRTFPSASTVAGLAGELLPALSVLLPTALVVPLRTLHGPVTLASLGLNMLALAWLLKRSFLDTRPVPTDVLSAD